MTFEQLSIFIAVAERQHLTRAAASLGLTPSAVSASIKALESFYNVRLFDRVGRGIELSRDGQFFLKEARETLARVEAAETVLSELGGLKRGRLDVHASQTIANYWLPSRLLQFKEQFSGISMQLTLGNTMTVAAAVLSGAAELGFIEGDVDEPALLSTPITEDRLVIVTAAGEPDRDLASLKWVMREEGSGTRAMFEAGLADLGVDHHALSIVLVLPSNESVLTAVRSGGCATALSRSVVAPFVENGQLQVLDIALPPRQFTILRHRERRPSAAALEFAQLCHGSVAADGRN